MIRINDKVISKAHTMEYIAKETIKRLVLDELHPALAGTDYIESERVYEFRLLITYQKQQGRVKAMKRPLKVRRLSVFSIDLDIQEEGFRAICFLTPPHGMELKMLYESLLRVTEEKAAQKQQERDDDPRQSRGGRRRSKRNRRAS